MRILILVNEFPPGPGGVGTHAYALAHHLTELGHSLNVVCEQLYSSKEMINTFNNKQKFKVCAYPQRKHYLSSLVSRLQLVYRTVRSHKPDILLASGSNSVWIGAFYRFVFRSFKLVVVVHGGELTFRPWIRKELTKLGCRLADKIVSVSNYSQKFLPKSLVVKTSVIHNGADHLVFVNRHKRQDLKAKHGYSGKRILLTVGSVSHRKGQDIVIKAMKLILSTYPNAIYVMAGRSNNMEFFQDLAKREGVEQSVNFLGAVPVDHLVELYNLADLYVLASRHSSDGDFEGFGISVIEAALCGIPAVVTQDSGLIEAIEEGATGFSVPTENPEALADKVLEVFDKDAYLKLGIEAQKRAEGNFTWARAAQAYHRLLTDMK